MRLVCLSNSCENDYSEHGQNQITVNIVDAANEECADHRCDQRQINTELYS